MTGQNRFDVFFFSCGESYAEIHYKKIKNQIPYLKRVDGYKTTPSAWRRAAELSSTSHFFSIDADNLLNSDFSWEVPGFYPEDQRIHVWRCRNPVNGLVYGHGAVKLWFVQNVIKESQVQNEGWVDFTCQLSKHGFCIQSEVASTAYYNASAEETFVSAYKETIKLISGKTRYANCDHDPNLNERLFAWANLGADSDYGDYSILGARRAILDWFRQPQDLPLHFSREYRQHLWQTNKDLNVQEEIIKVGKQLEKFNFSIFRFSAEKSAQIKLQGVSLYFQNFILNASGAHLDEDK